ncbi:hypothetical protein [Bradyrhizobium sp. CCGB20]|uniref:hypothetical protein n=1 Tax=Bradyrhizobium sp. CCGB20 TaxID=2949633 RepID=UPI0020B37B5B|nr:hypothetical protein [Bradyrhizobium sp. CCGB20]MCP3398234.1 hypothetical protein [Bradyrhizobium sp. CCGB20]
MGDWYLWDGSENNGPMDWSEVGDRIQRHSNPDLIRVWRDGLVGWKTIAEALAVVGTGSLGAAKLERADEAPQSPVSRNIVAKHWKGEFPLGISYWVVGLGSNILAGVVIGLLGAFTRGSHNPTRIFVFYVLLWSSIACLCIWQFVGTWRSAQRRKGERAAMGKRAVWAWTAQFMICLGVLNAVVVFVRTAIPQIAEATSIAFMDDPRIPSYSIRLLNNGSEIEISGGIKFGLSTDFEKILNASPGVGTVHLDSIGGRIGEGERLSAIIKSRGLDTYVEANCMSACTLAFVAGRQRVLKKGAQLGFHRAAFAGDDGLDDSAERSIYKAAGISSSFIEHALVTRNADMWSPSEAELLSARVVTRISSGDEYAFGGTGGRFTRDDWDKVLQNSASMYRALKQAYPQTYDEILDIVTQGTSKGIARAELTGQARAKVTEIIGKLLPLADDSVLIDFGKLVIDQYSAVQAQDGAACYRYASGQPDQNLIKLIPARLAEREVELNARIIMSAQKRPDPVSNDRSWEKIRAGLNLRGYTDNDLELLNGKSVGAADYVRYCDVAIALYREITSLPPTEAAGVLREFLS